jgi:nucleoside-diphosphate-sugar epimerase
MKVVVAGGSGLVGRIVATHLAAYGHDVPAVDRVAPSSASVRLTLSISKTFGN